MSLRSSIARWRFAAKVESWPKLLVPCVLGHAIGFDGRTPSWLAVALGSAFTLAGLLFIVLLNDVGDREVDRVKRRMFPATSRKTIPDGILGARSMAIAGIGCGILAIGAAVAARVLLDRPHFVAIAAFGMLLLAVYTFPPLRLNYRGGGELVEAFGVGLLLPWMQAYLQSGRVIVPGLWLLLGFAPMALASAIASGLSDERSDRRGGKRTFVTLFGNRAARRAAELAMFAGASAWALLGVLTDALPAWVAVPPALVALFEAGAMTARSEAAFTDAFDAQRRYKAALHRAMWRGALVASVTIAAWSWVAS